MSNRGTALAGLAILGLVVYMAMQSDNKSQVTTEPAAKQETALPDIGPLPDRTPKGIPVEKPSFYVEYQYDHRHALKPEEYLGIADAAVSLARLNGLRCDSITNVMRWTWGDGWTMKCNHHRYKYEITDKGRGFQIKPAGE